MASNGGAAFPKAGLDPWHQAREIFTGMTLRDYFAAKAMAAAATNEKGADGFTFAERASWAYQQADAMIAERDK